MLSDVLIWEEAAYSGSMAERATNGTGSRPTQQN